jgi:hypothetical protein
MKQFYAPNGKKIVAIIEMLRATADIAGFEPDGEPSYIGNTEVDWNSQEPVRKDGGRIFVDESEGEWPEKDCEAREESNEELRLRVSMSTAAFGVRIGDRIIQQPTWPDGREVVDFDLDDTRITFTYAGEDECKETFGAADHVIVSRIV